MDTSIRLYNSNSRLRSTLGTETRSYSTSPLQEEEDRSVEVSGDEEERVTDSISSQSISVLEEPAQRVDVADFEAIFQRFQGPDRKSTRLNSSHSQISYAVFCL